ncbi:MAG: four helix bundle protein [candidate division WOR-3 bacterium]|nr:four helix bundle protein [candidate division WOR-3 bacterium]
MTNRPQRAPVYDLEDRTAAFGEAIIAFARSLPESTLTRPLISQIIRAGTSVGANYCEADEAESKKDFRHKIAICKKEARETRYWLRLIAGAVPDRKEAVRPLWQEAKELTLIFSAIMRSADGKAG